MKAKYLAMLAVCLLALALPGAALADGNITNELNQTTITSTVGSTVAAISGGAISGRISGVTGFGGGGTGGGGTGGGGTGGGGTGGGGTGGGGTGGGGTGGGQGTGQSSGDNPLGVGLWTLGGMHVLDGNKAGATYDGTLTLATVGVDKFFGSLLAGIGFGYEKLDLTTKYNAGKMGYDGFSITPYLSYSISSDLVADASFSYVFLNYTMRDTQATVKFSDTMNANRMITSLGLSKYLTFDKLMLSARLGTMYLNEQQGSYQLNLTPYGQTSVHTWQGTAGLRATYNLGAYKPFVGATYMRDFMKSGPKTIDVWGTDVDLGFTYNFTDQFLLGLTGTGGLREYMTKYGAMLNLRYDF